MSFDPRPSGTRPLVGYPDLWRIRVGDYRVVYTVKDAELAVLVLRVAHRNNVYRNIWTEGCGCVRRRLANPAGRIGEWDAELG
ncbi:MAG TPA: type II toxin-antitoxin system RelE/ParE family toxin [Dermatophilaceae bacterium]